jgi:hypothetical protein
MPKIIERNTILLGLNDYKSRCTDKFCNNRTCSKNHYHYIRNYLNDAFYFCKKNGYIILDFLLYELNKKNANSYRDEIIYTFDKNPYEALQLVKRILFQKNFRNNTDKKKGAILLFSNNKITGEDEILLFKSWRFTYSGRNKGRYYNHLIKGGSESFDKSIEDTAMRELKEESCNAISIKNLDGCSNIEYPDGSIKCYFLKLKESYTRKAIMDCYYNNLNILHEDNFTYHETKEIVCFNFRNIIDKIKDINFNDINPMEFRASNCNYEFIGRDTLKIIYLYNSMKKEASIVNIDSETEDLDGIKTVKLLY